jgi:hypothetical protein
MTLAEAVSKFNNVYNRVRMNESTLYFSNSENVSKYPDLGKRTAIEYVESIKAQCAAVYNDAIKSDKYKAEQIEWLTVSLEKLESGLNAAYKHVQLMDKVKKNVNNEASLLLDTEAKNKGNALGKEHDPNDSWKRMSAQIKQLRSY